MAGPGKEYIVGKGRLFFDKFPAGQVTGEGERYLGNTPELTTSADSETLDHFDSDEGLNVKDESVTIETSLTGQFTTDNISAENIAEWFGGDLEQLTIASASGQTQVITAKLGRFFQIGASPTTPNGARNITITTITKIVGGMPTPVTASGNFEYDLENGRVYIEPDAPGVEEEDELTVTYGVAAGSRTLIVGKGQEVRGALRFLSKNPVGNQRNYFWPYVKLTSNGDYALKGDDWQTMSFSIEFLKKDATTERVYVEAIDA
jgi:hypothetical protein